VSALAGAKVGGLFLAFPAILLASLTLVAQKKGDRQARDEARGAIVGTIGMLIFAVSVAVLAQRVPIWITFWAASVAWLVVALVGYLIIRRLGGGESSGLTGPRSRLLQGARPRGGAVVRGLSHRVRHPKTSAHGTAP
jgi:uncharacterized membrane protein (GlpM family)